MWSMRMLLGMKRHVQTLIVVSVPTKVYAAFRHLPQFVMHALVYGCCTSVSVPSLMPLLAMSEWCHLHIERSTRTQRKAASFSSSHFQWLPSKHLVYCQYSRLSCPQLSLLYCCTGIYL